MRELARFIMRGRFYAIATTSLFGALALILPPLSLLSGATVGLVTLHHGTKEGLTIAAGAMLIVAVIFLAMVGRPDLAFLLLLGLWLPSLLSCWILRLSQSQTWALLMIGSLATLFIIGMHLLTGDVVAWWQQWAEKAISQAHIEGITVEQLTQGGALALMNGLAAMFFGINLMLIVLLARWWQSLLYNPGGFAKEFYTLRLPRSLTMTVILIAAIVLTGIIDSRGHILTDLFIVSVMLYLFQGLAAMHGMAAVRKVSQLWLLPLYVGLFILPPYIIVGLAMVGIVDSLINFRSPPSAKT